VWKAQLAVKARETKELKDLLDKQEKVKEYRKHTADRLLRYVMSIDENRVG
jgi:hypothetical protein